MIVPYTELPGAGGWPRPILDVSVAGLDDATFPCLADTGSINSLLPGWIATEAGLELRQLEARAVVVGGSVTEARLLPVRLTAVGHTWEAEVGFAEPWPYAWGLLGQVSFFRYFTVTFRAADFELEVVPVEN
ncbi:MAG: hypothetical protein ACYCSJ_07670 [Acidimicrobiales bacterium]